MRTLLGPEARLCFSGAVWLYQQEEHCLVPFHWVLMPSTLQPQGSQAIAKTILSRPWLSPSSHPSESELERP